MLIPQTTKGELRDCENECAYLRSRIKELEGEAEELKEAMGKWEKLGHAGLVVSVCYGLSAGELL